MVPLTLLASAGGVAAMSKRPFLLSFFFLLALAPSFWERGREKLIPNLNGVRTAVPFTEGCSYEEVTPNGINVITFLNW
jgi:hypothetical protein